MNRATENLKSEISNLTRILPVTLAGVAALLAALTAGPMCAGGPPADATARRDLPPADTRTVAWRGVAIQLNNGWTPLQTYVPMLREIAELGADTVLLSTAAHMEHAKAQALFIDHRFTPGRDELAALLKEARKLGLRTILMPIVLIRHPRGSEWRGVIEPPDWKEWWREYREMIGYFADAAREGGADAFMVGSELVSTEKNQAEWLEVIKLARERFPGLLSYSANWDHYKPVKFWDKLDFISMTSYYTLADKKGASVEEIVKRWQPIRREIGEWQKTIRKPLVLTEVGWCSQEGAATAPWNYYQNQKPSPAGLEEQRRLYEAFIRAWDGAPGLGGVIWWEWTDDAGGADDFSYSPKGKPAEGVLREWLRRRPAGGSGAAAGAVPGD